MKPQKYLFKRSSHLCLIAIVNIFVIPLASAQQSDDLDLSVKFQQLMNKVDNLTRLVESQQSQIDKLESENVSLKSQENQDYSQLATSPEKPQKNRKQPGLASFNPSIGVILNGRYSSFSNGDSEISGFSVGEEGERGNEGLAIDESELNFSANVDDKFFGHLTAALVREDGEDIVELEEAFVQTQPGMGLLTGLNLKAGRAFWVFGYLNEHHTHVDDFADRPLPYRAYLNSGFNDDGVQVSYVLPTDFYSEIGGGVFRGDDFPFGSASGSGASAWSSFVRIGGDIGEDQNWRFGGYLLSGDTDGRFTSEDEVSFIGDTELYATDLRYTWAPTGNPREQEVILQGEYLWRNENGTYEDAEAGTGEIGFDYNSSGYYAQAIFKFLRQWRVGARYSQLLAPSVPVGLLGSSLDSAEHDPSAYSTMIDWTNSEFSRFRFQFNREDLSHGQSDNQLIIQYIMSFGAHAAHAY